MAPFPNRSAHILPGLPHAQEDIRGRISMGWFASGPAHPPLRVAAYCTTQPRVGGSAAQVSPDGSFGVHPLETIAPGLPCSSTKETRVEASAFSFFTVGITR